MDKVLVVTTSLLIISVFVFVWLERRYPYTKGMPIFREGFWVDLVWYTFIQSYFLKIVIFQWIILPVDHRWHLSRLQLVTHWPVALQVLFFLVIHEAHHSNKEVDWLAGTRSHTLEILINQTAEFAPIVLLGASPIVVPIKALLDAVWGMYIHANIDIQSGKLQYFINGPEMHQWHHSNDRAVFFANYSTKFALWDWLFGTAYLPGRKKPDEFGLPYDYPRDYFLQHVFAIKRFDEKRLVSGYPLFAAWYHSRQWVVKLIAGWMGRRKRKAAGKGVVSVVEN
jgi:sterol desaturase/sphingolipid hydroxylase (fatty acid hydroxylase superfamily)